MDFIMDRVLPVLVVILMTVMFAILAFIPFNVYVSNVCLQNNYPNSYVVLPYEIKCGKIVNQTEYVCSLGDVLSNNCLPE